LTTTQRVDKISHQPGQRRFRFVAEGLADGVLRRPAKAITASLSSD